MNKKNSIILIVVLVIAVLIPGIVLGIMSTKKNELPYETEEYVTMYMEGMEYKVLMKRYHSVLGYSMSYDPEYFTITNANGKDNYETTYNIGNIVVEKEKKNNILLSKLDKVELNKNIAYKRTIITNGNIVTTYYVEGKKDDIFIITTTYKNDSEYIEGIGARMSSIVNTFILE